MNLHELTIGKAHELLNNRDISSMELTKALLDRIDSLEDKIGAYITITDNDAMVMAERADNMISDGKASLLTGIPLAIKDLICTSGIRTTCASKILEHFVPPYDAFVIQNLKEQGAVIIGKANMDEFAMGSSTEHSRFKITHNPWDLNHIPGGSSGGSAAAVAADMCIGALGSDTGGSIRQPASHCGVVGLKPTYGRVSRYGLVAFASSFDQIGPITKNVEDCAVIMNAISGYDKHDSTSVPKDIPDYTEFLKKGLSGMKVGIPIDYVNTEGVDPDVLKCFEAAVSIIKDLGAVTIEISLPHSKYSVAAYYIITPSEASSNLARYDGVKYGFRDNEKANLMEMYRSTRLKGFGSEVQRRIILGTYALSAGYYDAYYKKASQVRTLIAEDFTKAFELCDVIISPVAPTPAFKIGEKSDDPLTMYLSDIFTLSANLAGIPGMSVPCGFSSQGLPIGLQLLGNHFGEGKLLQVGHQFEQAAGVFGKRPEI
jgi:aspartyl-tRNA(Asn)/glutamyl-tRNA(Gln) amidotransferase subunit A